MKYDNNTIAKIEEDLSKRLSPDRFMHTLGVAGCAACLAMRYGLKPERAYIAGLFHDYAKEHTDKAFLDIAQRENIQLTEYQKMSPYLIHGIVAAVYAKRDYDIDDEELLDSLRYHTCARKHMGMLEKIIYVADYIEPHRECHGMMDKIRKTAFENIDEAMYLTMRDTLDYLEKKNKPVTSDTYEAMEYYKKRTSKHNRHL